MKFELEELALKAFKDHELTVLEDYDIKTLKGEYVWAKPNTGIYSVHIIFRNSTIIMYGDIGTWVLRQPGIDLPWLRGSVDSPNYLFEKLTREHNRKYNADKTKAYALECLEQDENLLKEDIEKIKKTAIREEFDEEYAMFFFGELIGYDDAYEFLQYTWDHAVYAWAALKTFMTAIDKHMGVEK